MAHTAESRFIFVESRAGNYRTQYESECGDVIQESGMAIVCFDFADLVVQGNNLYESINSLDNDWRTLVFTDAVAYAASFENRIKRLYAGWLDTSKKVVVLYEKIESEFMSRGFGTEPIHALRRAIREVEGISTPDNDFFNHTKLVDLRDKAIDECHNGTTVEYA